MKFIFTTLKKGRPLFAEEEKVFIAHEDICHKPSQENCEMVCHEILELRCDHGEADMRMITHAGHACRHNSTVIIIVVQIQTFSALH